MVAVIASERERPDTAEEIDVFHKTLNIRRAETIASDFFAICKKEFPCQAEKKVRVAWRLLPKNN